MRPMIDAVLTMAPAALLEHLRNFCLHREPYALEIDSDDAVEVFLFVVGGAAPFPSAGDAGVVEGAVQAAESLDRLVDHELRPIDVGNVGVDQDSLASGLYYHLHRFLATLRVHVHHHHASALAGVGQGCGPSDAGTSTRH